ncbi:MAG: Stk1 family PASTA domain-containing Ser/Thr kinase [Epulopiscium sp.]|nr:Stk1 family PASTA domain-containing Ser/Thr kinase [Candidatus Epulonipiscium sp.]
MLQQGTVLSSRYEIIEKIGAGGMSVVYKAKCNKLQRYVAIKVLREEFVTDEQFVSRFRVEAQAAASLSHPNIVGIYDVGNEDNIHYIVMEYIHGETLKETIASNAPFSSPKVLSIAMDIASALQHAHKKNIIHRDIKPQNILITDEGVLKVADFGIARTLDSSTVVTTGKAIGSVHYFSPEQARGGYVDKNSDIYSLGIVMYEMATKTLPFEGESPVTVALKHINEEIPSPRSINTDISSSLEDIIMKSTQKRPENRYKSVDEMIKDMESSLQHPNGNFVKKSGMENSPTIQMTENEMKLLRGEPKNSPYEKLDTIPKASIAPIEEEKNPREKWVTVGAIFTSVILIIVISAIGIGYIKDYLEPKVVMVPPLINMTFEDADEFLKEKQLILVRGKEVYDENIEEGKIVSQDPIEGTVINFDSKVVVNISKGFETFEVPDVESLDYDTAIMLLEKYFSVKISPEYNDTVEENYIISQDPRPRTKLRAGETVTIVVSRGEEIITVPVPYVVKLSEEAAKNQLKNSGLRFKISYVPSSEVEKGYVISQGVAEGEMVKEGFEIDLVVSEGIEEEPADTDIGGPIEKYIEISAPLNADTTTFHVRVRLNGENRFIYENTHDISEFPLQIPVIGEGEGYIEIYINDNIQYKEPIEFK